MHKLETELDVALFDKKSKNNIELNETGKLMLEHVNKVLKAVDDLKLAVASLSSVLDLKRLNFCSCEPSGLRVLLPALKEKYPEMNVTYTLLQNEQECVNSLISGKNDIALFYCSQAVHPELYSLPVYSDRILIRVPLCDPLSKNKKLEASDIDGKEVLVLCDSPFGEKYIEEFEKNNNIHIKWKKEKEIMIYYSLVKSNKYISFSTKVEKDTFSVEECSGAKYFPLGKDTIIPYYATYLKSKKDIFTPLQTSCKIIMHCYKFCLPKTFKPICPCEQGHC